MGQEEARQVANHFELNRERQAQNIVVVIRKTPHETRGGFGKKQKHELAQYNATEGVEGA